MGQPRVAGLSSTRAPAANASAPPTQGAGAMWLAVAALGIVYIGSTALTPLFPLYRKTFGFSELVVTEVYASYVIGNLAVLFFFGRISDQIGRRPTALVALAITGLSALCFLCATSVIWLFAARALNGFAAGLGAGALTAWVAELEPRRDSARGSAVATSGNLTGLAFGALLSGALAQTTAWPLRAPFAAYLVILALTMVLLSFERETVSRRVRSFRELSLRPRLGVPRERRVAFIGPAAIAFASFALGGFYAALAPGLLVQRMGRPQLIVVGAIVALFFGSGGLAAAVTKSLSGRLTIVAGAVILIAGLVLLVLADALRSFPWLVAATFVCGVAVALGYRGSLRMINEMAADAERAELVSSYLLVCYTANALPVVGVGLLTTVIGAETSHRVFAAVLAVLGVVAAVLGGRFVASGHAPRRSPDPDPTRRNCSRSV